MIGGARQVVGIEQGLLAVARLHPGMELGAAPGGGGRGVGHGTGEVHRHGLGIGQGAHEQARRHRIGQPDHPLAGLPGLRLLEEGSGEDVPLRDAALLEGILGAAQAGTDGGREAGQCRLMGSHGLDLGRHGREGRHVAG